MKTYNDEQSRKRFSSILVFALSPQPATREMYKVAKEFGVDPCDVMNLMMGLDFPYKFLETEDRDEKREMLDEFYDRLEHLNKV